jgi:hypothetical protein
MQLDFRKFAREIRQRRGNIMWLLGAGASAAAGIPTAWDMIWEFKQQLYVSQRRVSPKQVADLPTRPSDANCNRSSTALAVCRTPVRPTNMRRSSNPSIRARLTVEHTSPQRSPARNRPTDTLH